MDAVTLSTVWLDCCCHRWNITITKNNLVRNINKHIPILSHCLLLTVYTHQQLYWLEGVRLSTKQTIKWDIHAGTYSFFEGTIILPVSRD